MTVWSAGQKHNYRQQSAFRLITIILLLCCAIVIIGEYSVIVDLQNTIGRYRQSMFESETVKSNIRMIPNHNIYTIYYSL